MRTRSHHTAAIENEFVRFSISSAGHSWLLEDKRAHVSWGASEGLGPWVVRVEGEERIPLSLSRVEILDDDALRCRFVRPGGQDGGLTLAFRLLDEALQVYVVYEGPKPPVLELFGAGLDAPAEEGGEALLPIRMGLLVPAAGTRPFDLRFGTYEYEGLHLAMTGLMKDGAALLACWQDPYIGIRLARRFEEQGPSLRLRFELGRTARSLELRCLGKGDLKTLAAAYRARAVDLGYRVPWHEKLPARPQAAKLFGASNVKLWHALARTIDEDLVEQDVTVHYTFDEAAQIAEHLAQDLQLDRVLFHLGGWTRYGYDCRHPDNMPANEECGGNAGLADCSARVRALGYLFCLHDNYQDIYRDAPSWDERWLQKQPDGSPTLGGVWLGGRAYYTCAREALRLAQRPENLPLIQQVSNADVYFIDTTYAVGPQECYDPRHPLTRQEDILWKAALSDYARDLFGLFGSECGREWAVPHADFFEGLTSVSGDYYHQLKPAELSATPVPFFDMVFHDCIAIHGKYGYEPQSMAEQVIHHAAMGRALYYHSLGDHLYWQDPAALPEVPAAPGGAPDPALYTRASGGWADGFCLWDRFMKNTHEILSPLYLRTAEALIDDYAFLDSARLARRTTFSNGVIVFVNGAPHAVEVNSARFGRVMLPTYGLLVEAPDFAAAVVTAWQGLEYESPTLFTLTASDGLPLEQSAAVHVFHGFGDNRLPWRGQVHTVAREAVLEP